MAEQKKSLKWWYYVLAALLILILASTQLPNDYTLKREAVVNIEKECARELIGDFNNWIQWYYPNPENVDTIPTAIFFGEKLTSNHEMWVPYRGDTVIHQLTNVSDNEIAYSVSLLNGGEELSGKVTFEAKGNGKVKVIREETSEIGLRPLQRYLNLFMEINPRKSRDMEKSLARMEEYCKQ